MKRNILLVFTCVTLLLVTAICLFGCSGKPASVYQNPNSYSFLHADGRKIVNEKGEEVRLRGTNAGSYLVQESWMNPTSSSCHRATVKTLTERFGYEKMRALYDVYKTAWWTEQDFDNVKSIGFNVIRLPFSYLNLTVDPDEPSDYYQKGFDRIRWFVDECAKRELYVILDLHGAIGSQSGYDHSGDTRYELYSTPRYMDATVALWEKIASLYVGNKTVAGYDLLNEPLNKKGEGTSGKVQWNFYDRLYKAIRKIDPDHMIFIEGMWSVNALPMPYDYGWENVVYEFHNYQWAGSDSPVVQTQSAEKKVTSYKKFNVPVLIGEFNAFSEEKSWIGVLNAYENGGCNWTTWSYKMCTDYEDKTNSWGLYCGTLPKIDPKNDSYERIEEIWGKTSTAETCCLNEKLAPILRNYTGATEAA